MSKKNEFSVTEKKTLKKMWWSEFFGGLSFTMTKMQANGFTIIMAPALNEVYKDDLEGKKEALRRHNQFYNSQICMTAFIAGLCYALEKKKKKDGSISADTIQSIKVSLMGPTAGIGDAFFYTCLRVIAAGVAMGLCGAGNPLGILMFILIYIVPDLILRWYLLKMGYSSGTKFIDRIFESGLVECLTKAASILGIVMIGSMIPGVPVALNWKIDIGSTEVVIVDILNSIMPNILSVGVVLLFVYLIKKGVKATTIIWFVLILSILLAAIGVF